MLTRLKVSGFKNLVDVDAHFGPFTCVAGANAVGKSNLFDAIHFLSALTDRPFIDAALSVRDKGGRATDIRSLFHRVGNDYDDQMSFEAEMIIPKEGWDDLGQKATATITFLRYSVTIAHRINNHALKSLGSIEILKEELIRITQGEAFRKLLFRPSVKWRKSAIRGRRIPPFISTEGEGENRVIKLHQDGKGGRTLRRPAKNLPRTVLSVTNAAESPTALLARREMQSWRLLQLEPSSLRKPDEFTAPGRLGMDGSHLAATLYQLARRGKHQDPNLATGDKTESQVYGQVASRLSELIDDVYEVGIDRDEKRELLTLHVTDRSRTSHPARALSDGTLRFLALAVLELDPEAEGLLCLEEPENGIHPERIPAMLKLLEDIATDVDMPIGPDNPLRQVIANTHSPAVVSQVADDSLLFADLREVVRGNRRFKRVSFSCLPGTWRTNVPGEENTISRGKLLSYLNPVALEDRDIELIPYAGPHRRAKRLPPKRRRVVDREDFKQLLIPFKGESSE
ncbi:MAG TPA: AAA family ATPase [Syntrophobacteraceae bacterium]|nr:AAA family ATPase [Syntrophobacteraceae bacterium]